MIPRRRAVAVAAARRPRKHVAASLRDAIASFGETRLHVTQSRRRGSPAFFTSGDRTMREIRGKKALVTGAASGIGRAIALRLGAGRREPVPRRYRRVGMAETAAECRQRASKSSADGATCRSRASFGRGRRSAQLAGTASISWSTTPASRTTARPNACRPSIGTRLLQINLLSHVQFTRELLPSLLARREAHVLNVCSVFGLVGMPKVTAYCTSKFGMVGFSEALRNEFGREGLGSDRALPRLCDDESVHERAAGRSRSRSTRCRRGSLHDAGARRERGDEGDLS